MSLRPGFDVMDVDTSIANDPKFKRILRVHPEHIAPAFMAYVSLLGESWKAAERVTIVDSWPVILTFDASVVKSMTDAELIDKTGRIPVRAWRKRFTEANERRLKARDRWARYNAKRPRSLTNDDADTTSLPRGNNADTATSVPSVPLRSVPSVPSVPTGAHDDGQYDAVVRWLASRKAWVDSPKLQTDLARMVDKRDAATVIAVMDGLPEAEDAAQFIYGARNVLFPLNGSGIAPAAPKGHHGNPKEIADAFRS